jgi:uncharacterized protein (TIGR00730 family)
VLTGHGLLERALRKELKMARERHPEKAYKNLEFLNGPAARTIRIMCEYTEPLTRFEKYGVRNTIVFFGSSVIRSEQVARKELREIEELIADSNPSEELIGAKSIAEAKLGMSRYYEEAVELSEILTEWSKSLIEERQFAICTGGGPGIMEAANLGASRAGGESIGLNISLPHEQKPNSYISENLGFEFHYFFMRKFWLVHLAKALIVFPGGFGTLDELFEVLTLEQTRKLPNRVPVLMYGSEYWRKVINFDVMVEQGMISRSDLDLFNFADTPQEAFEYLKTKLVP